MCTQAQVTETISALHRPHLRGERPFKGHAGHQLRRANLLADAEHRNLTRPWVEDDARVILRLDDHPDTLPTQEGSTEVCGVEWAPRGDGGDPMPVPGGDV